MAATQLETPMRRRSSRDLLIVCGLPMLAAIVLLSNFGHRIELAHVAIVSSIVILPACVSGFWGVLRANHKKLVGASRRWYVLRFTCTPWLAVVLCSLVVGPVGVTMFRST